MRRIVRSRTSVEQLRELLDQGARLFGFAVAQAKLARLNHVLENHLAHFPRTAGRDHRLGLHVYAISQTPFVVLYDFDDDELRVYFVVHGRADRQLLDRSAVTW